MMLFRLSLLLCFALLHIYAQESARQKPPTFSVSVNLIKVPVAVLDSGGASVANLHAGDFRLFEDGIAQEVRSMGADVNPVSVVLVLDTSATVKQELKSIKEAAAGFVDALGPKDQVSIITFDDEVTRLLDWTADKSRARKALRKADAGIRTALHDALFLAGSEQLSGIEGRKAIILLTDWLNNQSRVSLQDASLAVIQSQASLYVVSKTVIVRRDAHKQRRVVWLTGVYRRLFGDDNYVEEFFKKREAEMIDLAEKTGGRCYFPADYDEIPQTYRQVAQELKNQYYLTYISNQAMTPNSYHEIRVEYNQPHGRIIHRKGYYFEPRVSRRLRW